MISNYKKHSEHPVLDTRTIINFAAEQHTYRDQTEQNQVTRHIVYNILFFPKYIVTKICQMEGKRDPHRDKVIGERGCCVCIESPIQHNEEDEGVDEVARDKKYFKIEARLDQRRKNKNEVKEANTENHIHRDRNDREIRRNDTLELKGEEYQVYDQVQRDNV